jgi:hypothetical protein
MSEYNKFKCNRLNNTIQKKNKYYNIEKGDDESRDIYLMRSNYIINKIENGSKKNINELIKLSYIWRNVKFYKMVYSESLIKLL